MSSSTNFMESKTVLNFADPQIFYDRVLVVDEKKFYVASGELSVWSEHFRGLFSGNFDEAKMKEIELKELDASVFEIFLKIIYQNNSVILKVTDIIPLIELSYRFLAPIVLECCTEIIVKNLDRLGEIKLQLLETICIYGNKGLKKPVIDHFKNVTDLDNSTIAKLLKIGEEYKLHDLKKITASYMEKHLTFENCSEYLDCCEKFKLPELKKDFAKTIDSWKFNEIPVNLIINLTKSAFKHNNQPLKKKLRLSARCLTERCGDCINCKSDRQPGTVVKTFNWFLKEFHEEIFALPYEAMQFILKSTAQTKM